MRLAITSNPGNLQKLVCTVFKKISNLYAQIPIEMDSLRA